MKLQPLKGESHIGALFEHKGVSSLKGSKWMWVKFLTHIGTDPQKKGFYAAVSVSKRKFPRAVDRNRIKRQMKAALSDSLAPVEGIKHEVHSLWVFRKNTFPTYEELLQESNELTKAIFNSLADES